MKVIITPTENARKHNPDEPFESVTVSTNGTNGTNVIPYNTPVEITQDEFEIVSTASYPHPENQLSCKYFEVQVLSTVNEREANIAQKIVDEVKVFTAVYANTIKSLKPLGVDNYELVTAAIAVYEKISKDTTNERNVTSENSN